MLLLQSDISILLPPLGSLHGSFSWFDSDLLKVDLSLTPGRTCRVYVITTSLEPIRTQYDTKLNFINTKPELNCDAGDKHIITYVSYLNHQNHQ